ncbi:XRE family transcriptional regulator [Pseudomonas sp. 7P_10.2_Bac1]|uniref:helix-turn-helix domain-containing protein n=1 Tax=Pseudomonas sp. 7P_10.2_Bac1 TaxID=2971614 RepID=UPI0021C653BE|nr:XRE family transcriptional regulator [Pseudomonas sp. 7P_10.2_Bac1]MCU1727119.1 XRE family transcriptional regulator [Pseudomonas sp. 7P_10.2_Bac1]
MNKQEEITALAILIHDLRKHKKVTLKQLADKIGRSVGFLSQVERGLSRPTMADLTAISDVLDVPTTYFYNKPKPKALPWVTRPDERRTLYLANGITDILVSPKIQASFSMLESLLEAGATSGERYMLDSSEQGGYVLEGELTLWLGNDETPVTLRAGDSFQFDGNTLCRYANLTEQLTRVLWVYT